MKLMSTMVVVAGLAAAANAQISLSEIARFDIGGQFNGDADAGTNGSAIAWNGSSIFVAGFSNGPTSTATTGIVEYTNVFGGATVNNTFGVTATPAGRGYSGLDISGNQLASAYDFGSASANGIQAWDLAGANQWSKNTRGGSGVGFDPGFMGADAGVAWTTFGSGRRALQDAATGADIYTTADGMIITPDFMGSFWRDMDFADNGDMVARRSNDVVFFDRTGGNSGSASLLVENNENAPFVNGQNVAYIGGSPFGDFVIYNDRDSVGVGQDVADVLKVVDLAGNQLSLNISGSGIDLGNGYYDFSYDAASNTLAVLDFFNNEVYIYNVPTPGALGVLGLGGLVAARRRRG